MPNTFEPVASIYMHENEYEALLEYMTERLPTPELRASVRDQLRLVLGEAASIWPESVRPVDEAA